MKVYNKKTWQHEITGLDGNTMLFDVNIFDYEWRSTGKEVTVLDPLYQQEHVFDIYKVSINGKQYKFAAGEFSNCVWGFYTLKY